MRILASILAALLFPAPDTPKRSLSSFDLRPVAKLKPAFLATRFDPGIGDGEPGKSATKSSQERGKAPLREAPNQPEPHYEKTLYRSAAHPEHSKGIMVGDREKIKGLDITLVLEKTDH